MKTTKSSSLFLAIILVFALAMIINAQESGDGGKKQNNIVTKDAGAQGLPDPSPTGFSVRYMFTGVINDSSSREATAVYCTNFSAAAVDVRVEVWNLNPTITYSGALTLGPGYTRTFSTQNITGFPEDLILSPPPPGIYQGSGRVLTKQHANVICTVQALDPTNDPPIFVVKLPLFDHNGDPINSVRKIYLPTILNNQ